jgi:hypothetical protein
MTLISLLSVPIAQNFTNMTLALRWLTTDKWQKSVATNITPEERRWSATPTWCQE